MITNKSENEDFKFYNQSLWQNEIEQYVKFDTLNHTNSIQAFSTTLFLSLLNTQLGQKLKFSANHVAFRRKSKDWLAQNQDNVAEWGNMSILRLRLVSVN